MRGDAASEALLAAPTLEGGRCCVCGMPATNNHHVVAKGMGGTTTEGPTVPVCGMGNTSGCHRLAHGLGLSFRYTEKMGWYFCATDEAADDINKRRRRSGLPKIRGGMHTCYVEPDWDAVDEPALDDVATMAAIPPREIAAETATGDALHAIEAKIAEAASLESTLAYAQGSLLLEARAIFATTLAGRREAQQAFGAWVIDTLHFSKATVSRLELYASLPESASSLGASKGYYAAKAVKERLASVEDAIADASVLSVSDLRQRYWPREESPDATIVCPITGRDCKTAAPKGEPA